MSKMKLYKIKDHDHYLMEAASGRVFIVVANINDNDDLVYQVIQELNMRPAKQDLIKYNLEKMYGDNPVLTEIQPDEIRNLLTK